MGKTRLQILTSMAALAGTAVILVAFYIATQWDAHRFRVLRYEDSHGLFQFWVDTDAKPGEPLQKSVCAEVEGPVGGDVSSSAEGSIWAVDLPDRSDRHDPTAQYLFNDGKTAAAWAEKKCPSGAGR
jgi:hypothetical protein